MSEYGDVLSSPGYETYSQVTPRGQSFGNPIIDTLMYGAFGKNYTARPGEQQDVTDAEMQKLRSREAMNLQGEVFASNMLFKQAGFNPENNLLQFAGRNGASPDSAVSRMLAPLIGGNPMAAAHQMYAGLQGANIMGAFGRIEGVSPRETKEMMEVLEKSVYKTRGMDDDPITGKKGVTSQMNSEFIESLIADPQKARDEKIGMTLNTDGTENTKAADNFRKLGEERKKSVEHLLGEATTLDANEAKRGTKDFNEKLSKDVNDRIEKVLKDAGKITEEELKKGRDSHGILRQEVIKGIADKDQKRAVVESAGLDFDKITGVKLSEISEKIHNDRSKRDTHLNYVRMAREDYGRAEDELNNLDPAFDGTDAQKKKREELRATKQESMVELEKRLIAAGVKESDIKANKIEKGGGFHLGLGKEEKETIIDPKFLEEQQSKLQQHSFVEYKAEQYRQYKKAGGKYDGINFEQTRGFAMEDLSAGFTKAADLQLLGKKGDQKEKFEGFLKNSTGATDAARSVFGDKSQSELVGKISDLMGTAAGDMSSAKGGSDIEKFLRDMKATARVAGTSINAMLSTIDAARDLARNNPKLSTLSSGAISDMTVKAFQTTAAMSGVLSSTDIRRAGGTQELTNKAITEEQKVMSGAAAQGLLGIQQLVSGDSDKLKDVQDVMDEYKGVGLEGKNLSEFISKIQKKKSMQGVSTNELMHAFNDPNMSALGAKNKDFSDRASELTNKALDTKFYDDITRAHLNGEGKTPEERNKIIAEESQKFETSYSEAKKQNTQERAQVIDRNKKTAAALTEATGAKFTSKDLEDIPDLDYSQYSSGAAAKKEFKDLENKTNRTADEDIKYQSLKNLSDKGLLSDAGFGILKNLDPKDRKQMPEELTRRDFSTTYKQKQFSDAFDVANKKRNEEIEQAKKEGRKGPEELTMTDFATTYAHGDRQVMMQLKDLESKKLLSMAKLKDPAYFKRLDEKVKSESKMDTEMAKKYASRNAPLVTQAMSALMSGDAMGEGKTRDLLSIFGTENGYSAAQSEKLQTQFGTAIKTAHEHDFKGTAAALSSATGNKYSEASLKEAVNFDVTGIDNGKEARKELQNLKDNKHRTADEEQRFKALDNMDKQGFLSDSAFKVLKTATPDQKAKAGASVATAAAIAAEKEKKIVEEFDGAGGYGAKRLSEEQQFLEKSAKEATDPEVKKDFQFIQDYYKGNTKKMFEDEAAGEGAFSKSNEKAKAAGIDLGSEKFKAYRDNIKESGDKYESAKQAAIGGGPTSAKDGAQDDMTKQMSKLTEVFSKSPLTNAIVTLAGKV
jgi:hypothetical protein